MRRLARWFWIVPVVTVCACAFLAARTVNSIVAAKLIVATPAAPRHARPAPRRATAPPRAKDGAAVAERNLFCSSCPPETRPDAPPSDGRPPLSSLPLALIAIFNAGDAGAATVANTQTGNAGLYAVGDTLPGAGTVKRVRPTTVEIYNQTAHRLERIDLVAAAQPPPAPPAAATRPAPSADPLADAAVTRVDDGHYRVERALFDKVLGDPIALARQARALPVVESGEPQGFRLMGVRAGSLLTRLGIQNGDVIRSLNGFELTSPDKVLEAYSKLRSAPSVAIKIARAGKPVDLELAIR